MDDQLLDALDRPIFGAENISAAIDGVLSPRQVKYRAQQGQLPVSKAGRSLYTTLRRLLAWSNGTDPRTAELLRKQQHAIGQSQVANAP